VSARQIEHDYRHVRRNIRRQRRRVLASVARDTGADLWVGHWCSPEDVLLEYAKAGEADFIRAHLHAYPCTRGSTLTQALLLAAREWQECRGDHHLYIATMEALLACGAERGALTADVAAVLPSVCAEVLDMELPGADVRRDEVKRSSHPRSRL
jgi:hypothetical protein